MAADKSTGSPNQPDNPPNESCISIDVAITLRFDGKISKSFKTTYSLKRKVMVNTLSGANEPIC